MPPASAIPVDLAESQEAILAFLGAGSAIAEHEPPVRIDTHAASIFLSGTRAWKLKRAVRFDYLDFSTPERRHAALQTELRLNRRTAPELYLALHSVTRDPADQLAIDGEGEAVDWLLEMQRFPDDALFDILAGRSLLDTPMLMRLADRISAFHSAAEVVASDVGSARFQSVIDGNTASMAAFPTILAPAKVARLGVRLTATAAEFAPLLDERARTGRVRHGHGDLHLANIALIDGEPTLFDCLEFSADLATVDVLYDLAFLLMDLWQRDLRTEANIVFNRYLDLTAEDEDGITLLPLFLAVRATIRAHVLAAQSARHGKCSSFARRACDYLDLAIDLLEPIALRAVAVGGLSGTGKSTLARAIGGYLGRSPGARILRSDVLRKRIAGLTPETQLPATSYSTASSAAAYAKLDQMAAATLASGQAVIADAVFARRAERDAIATVAELASVRFDGLWLQAPEDLLIDRIASRDQDASDADARVVAVQARQEIGELGDWKVVVATCSPEKVVAAVLAMLNL